MTAEERTEHEMAMADAYHRRAEALEAEALAAQEEAAIEEEYQMLFGEDLDRNIVRAHVRFEDWLQEVAKWEPVHHGHSYSDQAAWKLLNEVTA